MEQVTLIMGRLQRSVDEPDPRAQEASEIENLCLHRNPLTVRGLCTLESPSEASSS